MGQMDDELKDAIKKGVNLEKPDAAEMKKREDEKKKRIEELEKVKDAIDEK